MTKKKTIEKKSHGSMQKKRHGSMQKKRQKKSALFSRAL
jgi:hypothetical protein